MKPERFESLRVWRAPAICLTISILLHALFWLGMKQLPHPEPKETAAQVITVSLTSAASAAPVAIPPVAAPVAIPPAAAPAAVILPPPAPSKPKPEPKKAEKAKAPKPKPEQEPESRQPLRGTTAAPAAVRQPSSQAESATAAGGQLPAGTGPANQAPFQTESGAAVSSNQHANGSGPAYSEANYKGPGLHNPPTRYPRLALERHWEGVVRLKVQVLPDGTAGDVQILQSSGHDLLDESALEHVKSLWRFEPARRGAQAVTSWVVIPIEFKMFTKD